ncbi:thermosome subunit alpha [Methanocorpusculum vombati]|uniref:Thermosome subunit alpha n=1 Tax=Methanocorpusculum vombati TaxID=3002864 RepID=A0ABT4IJK7_9EURY|nr:thermosome subunit alpha [Methanocorpusculum vombati]MCZ9311991.1 thermosome subunit alpha [Methanocorpusculum sp.]MCZ0861911.1 thermosome subunit alpha [Methanocorpusculum vombati]MCZ9320176.1 thermosome subunit alpha [Methanocorpusculum sp.]MDE2519940.1 thermosome subunit alpha [Methanocorpusculum sp.]MDE2533560.1 thermosome subunit alpha [Methanocorpusculum sp.]
MSSRSGQPVVILRDNVERVPGQEALRSNIMAAKVLGNTVRTTLGPRGMDKMLVTQGSDDIVITNDGATILHQIHVQHPGAKLVVEVAETQDDECGDGTTTAVVMVGSFMEQAENLIDTGVHPSVIAKGYNLGMMKALELLDSLAIAVTPKDKDMLKQIAKTAMTGKSIEMIMDKACDVVVEAVSNVAVTTGKKTVVNEDDILVKTKRSETMDAEMIKGVLIDKTRLDALMPKKIKGVKAAFIANPLEITKTQTKSKIKITSHEQLEAFSVAERETLRAMAEKFVETGVNVVLCQKGIADPVQYYLAENGIYALEFVAEKDLKYAAKALGGQIVNKPEDLTPEVIGTAGNLEMLEDIEMTKLSGCKNPQAVTILLRGSSQHLVDELERAIEDATRVVQDVVEDGAYLIGGGSVETELALRLREYAATEGGRVQLAIEGYAKAFEIIPKTLAENSGFDTVDKVIDLRQAHATGEKYAGLNVFTGKVVDMQSEGVVEPKRVKRQAIQSASETAMLLIRVDDMMISKGAGQA